MRKHAKKSRPVRAFSLILSALFLILAFPAIPVYADDLPELEHVQAAYLYNFEADDVLYELNVDAEVFPTSTVKIMTGIVALEELSDRLDEPITVTAEMLYPVRGNTLYPYPLQDGEIITPRQALYCLLMNNANDAAMVLAFTAAGSEDAFVGLMNKKAGELNAWSTHYTNCTGMHDDEMVTTVSDTVKIAKYAYGNKTFMEMVGTERYDLEETNTSGYRTVYNRNCLVSGFFNDRYKREEVVKENNESIKFTVSGMNAGSTPQGGYCAVTVFGNSEGPVTYLSVIMGADNDEGNELYNYKETNVLIDWALSHYSNREVVPDGITIPVRLSSVADYVTAVPDPEKKIKVFLPSDVNPEDGTTAIPRLFEDSLTAPVKAGQKVGVCMVVLNSSGEVLGTVDLIAKSDVPESKFLVFLAAIEEFASSLFFRAMLISVVVLSVGYVLLRARYRQKKLRARIPSTRPRRRL